MRPFTRSAVAIVVLLGVGWHAATAGEPQLSFALDILPVLSKQGCNSGSCHGKAIGQNGFKLSLYGFDPEFDFAALVHESHGRRVSPAAPEESLILQKASGDLAHGGGIRFAVDSEPYRLLKQWINQGLPWGSDADPRETQLEVAPTEIVRSGAAEQPLKVLMHYSDGSTRDVTKTARYDSQNPDLASVSAEGLVRVSGTKGESHVMVRYGDFVGTARVLVPWHAAVAEEKYAPFKPQNFIDELVLEKWREVHIAPSPAATDAEFLRRVFTDTLGTLPSPKEVQEFVADASPQKRESLIDRLFAREEFLDFWTRRFGDLLRNRASANEFKDQTIAFAGWIRQSLKDNKSYDKLVREIVTVSGKRKEHPQMDWYRWAINSENRVEDTAQAFLGMRVSCANCHNHPFENISQTDYWRFAAFFARVKSATYGSVDEVTLNDKGTIKHPRTEQVLTPKAFAGPEFEFVDGQDPREKLVDWMTAADNPYFARAFVNRVWGHYFGVGLVHPIDDMRATNPPTNPRLLDALAKDFIEHRFDLRHLIRTILQSRAYGLSSLPTDDNRVDSRNYARYYSRRMEPYVLLDAIAGATGVATKFENYPDVQKAVQLPNEMARSDFLEIFGRSERTTPCECETSLAPNLSQVLYLLNSEELERRLSDKAGTVADLAAAEKPPQQIVDELFLRTFSRSPSPEELADAVKAFEGEGNRRAAIEDLLWTLLNSKEFLFNH